MTSASPEFRHCLSSSFFLFSRDALTRSYRPEDFGHMPFAESGIDAATAERMRHQTGIELEVSDKRYDGELLAAVGSRCYLGPEFRELAGAIAPVMEAECPPH